MNADDGLWDTDDAARYLRLTPQTVRKKARGGLIPGMRSGVWGGGWRFRPADVRALVTPSTSSGGERNVAQLPERAILKAQVDAAFAKAQAKRRGKRGA